MRMRAMQSLPRRITSYVRTYVYTYIRWPDGDSNVLGICGKDMAFMWRKAKREGVSSEKQCELLSHTPVPSLNYMAPRRFVRNNILLTLYRAA